MHDHNIAYGHRHLTTTTDKPVQDFEALRREVERVHGIPGSVSGGPLSDPRGLLSALGQKVTTSATILEGVIHYVIPGTFTYRVILDGELGELICGDLMNASFTRSVRISQTYAVGTRVIVLKHHGLLKGTILGSPAREVLDWQYDQPVLASAIGRFHIVNREYVKNVVKSPDTGRGIPSYTQGRAVDVCEGDYMVTNMSEGGFFTSPFETSVRQSHDCGLWMFSMDRLLRMIGRSVQEYSLAHERYIGIDEHETYGFEGIAAYPWEALGYYREPDILWKKQKGSDVIGGKGISFMEPQEEKAEPFYRYQSFSGYLGQGLTREIRIPPKNLKDSSKATNLPDDGNVPITVAREQMLLDGTILQESARSIHLIKHANIRSFKRVKGIDDPRGDDMRSESKNSSYKFSQAKEFDPPSPQSATDKILWMIRKQSPSMFKEHRNDFEAISKKGQPFEQDVLLGDLSALKTRNSVEEPPTQKLHVDTRYGELEYGGGRATISLLDNGDIVLRNACGAELALRGANIEVSAPGDFRMNMGRSFISLAGDDIILRAKNSADLTATDNDVRIKAERNLDMVGGMSGSGRTLLENKAQGRPNNRDVLGLEGELIQGRGLHLKAENSSVSTFGGTVYLRSLEGGNILLDADQGNGVVKIDSAYTRIGGSYAVEIAAAAGDGTPNILAVTPWRTISKELLEVHSQIISSGVIVSDAGVSVLPADNFSKPIDQFNRTRRNQMDDRIANYLNAMPQWFAEYYWGQDMPGNSETIRNYAFSYRTTDQYGADRFSYEEPFWMELFGSEKCLSLATWSEPVYKYQEITDQQPWPGFATWSEESSMTTGISRWYDSAEQTDREEAVNAQPKKVILNEHLRIIDPE